MAGGLNLTRRSFLCSSIFFRAALLLLILTAAAVIPASAGSPVPLELEYPAGLKSISPGNTLTLLFRVTNYDKSELSITPEVILPPGWREVIPCCPLNIHPGKTANILLPLYVPEDAGAGIYNLEILLKDEGLKELLRGACRVEVETVTGLEITPLEVPLYVLSEPYQALFTVQNTGNTPREINFSCRENLGLVVKLEPDSASLNPGEALTVKSLVEIPAGYQESTRHYLTLQAQDKFNPELSAAETVTVEIITRELSAVSGYYTYPLTIRMNSNGEANSGWEVRGDGRLKEDSPERMSLKFGREQQFLKYYRPELAVSVGRQGIRLSPLVYISNTSSAVNLKYTPGKWLGQLISYRDEDLKAGWGARTAYQFLPEYNLGLQYLTLPADNSQIWTARNEFALTSDWDFDLEYGRQLHPATPAAVLSEAMRLTANYSTDNDHLYFNYTSREKSFLGREDNSEELKLYLSKKISVDCRLTGNISLRGEGEERLNTSGFLRGNARLQFNWSKNLPDQGWVYQRLGCEIEEEGRQNALYYYNYYHPLDRGNLNLYFNYQCPLNRAVTPEISAGLQAQRQLTERFNLSLGMKVEDLAAEEYRLEGRGEYRLVNENVLQLAAEACFYPGCNPELKARLAYLIPLQIPLERKNGLGEVSGRLLDTGGKGLVDIIVELNGLTAATANDGSFYFPAVPAGECYLTFRSADKFPAEYLTVPETPFKITVNSREVIYQEFTLIKGARIYGRVSMKEPEKKSLQAGAGKEGTGTAATGILSGKGGTNNLQKIKNKIQLKLTKEGTVRCCRLDSQGSFAFKGLAPGAWTLRVDRSSLPQLYQITPEEITLQLEEGEEQEIEIRISPVERSFEIQEGGTVGGSLN